MANKRYMNAERQSMTMTGLYSLKSKIIFLRHLRTSDISHQVQHKLIRAPHIHMAVRLTSSCQTGTEVSCTWTKHPFILRQNLTIHVHLVTTCGDHKRLTKYYYASFRPGVARIFHQVRKPNSQLRYAIG